MKQILYDISEPYDNPFWEKSNRGGKKKEKYHQSGHALSDVSKSYTAFRRPPVQQLVTQPWQPTLKHLHFSAAPPVSSTWCQQAVISSHRNYPTTVRHLTVFQKELTALNHFRGKFHEWYKTVIGCCSPLHIGVCSTDTPCFGGLSLCNQPSVDIH